MRVVMFDVVYCCVYLLLFLIAPMIIYDNVCSVLIILVYVVCSV